MDINFTLLNAFGTIAVIFGLVVIWAIYSPDEEVDSSNKEDKKN
jgi:hypothetical protein